SKIRAKLADSVRDMAALRPGFAPHLVVVQVGNRDDSSVYVRMKGLAAQKAGITFTHQQLDESATNAELLSTVERLNRDMNVHGILVQLPLPAGLDERAITEAIDPRKDVDGFHSMNIGQLAKRDHEPMFEPCTPKGVMSLLAESGIALSGKRAVVIGRSNIVGMPISQMLQAADATVTVCHSKTKNLEEIVSTADVIVAAVGSPELIKGSWIKPGAVVIDVGTNAVP
ncbi:tetrahydrofolate dehydrogenase/cyclohydrolase, partial [Blyttiomyces helicus]